MSETWEPDVSRIDIDLRDIVEYISHLTQTEKDLLSMVPGIRRNFNGRSFLELHLAFNDITSDYQRNCELYTPRGAKPSFYIHLYDLFLESSPTISQICGIRDYLVNSTSSQNIDTSHSRAVMANCVHVAECMNRLMSTLCWVTRRYRNMDGFDKNDQTNDVSFP